MWQSEACGTDTTTGSAQVSFGRAEREQRLEVWTRGAQRME